MPFPCLWASVPSRGTCPSRSFSFSLGQDALSGGSGGRDFPSAQPEHRVADGLVEVARAVAQLDGSLGVVKLVVAAERVYSGRVLRRLATRPISGAAALAIHIGKTGSRLPPQTDWAIPSTSCTS